MKTMTRVHAVIPAAGRGVRFGSAENKVFQKLHGRSLIEWTVDAFRPFAHEIIVMAGIADYRRLEEMVAANNVCVVPGGQTRQESVWNGLKMVEGDDTIVMVHDAARPLVSPDIIDRCLNSAREFGAAVAAIPIADALKRADCLSFDRSIVAADIDRTGVWAAQTPQAFRLDILKEAHAAAARDGFEGPDEASLVQRLEGHSVHLVMGDRRNLKITTEEDLAFAALITIPQPVAESRVGIGYDIHRLVDGRPLWLGGVLIPSKLGLDGHSDADVVLHAICDSLLGAAGLPDIGNLFPNTDPEFARISSLVLLDRVRAFLLDKGWQVGNVDANLA
jgi:2-C-methyl-D-erythritol 4-phosphate cytidylyltransferase/2-C-methyl-D-erythritol 2,4-cyclodiphosphate synthase